MTRRPDPTCFPFTGHRICHVAGHVKYDQYVCGTL